MLKKFIKTWDKVTSLEKLEFILSYSGNIELPANLSNKLRELCNLRNWIAHGFTYTTTFLLEPKSNESIDRDRNPSENINQDQNYIIVDMEENVDWQKKFPNTKFKPLVRLDYEDAQIALTIVLETLKLISDSFSQPFNLVTCEYPPEYKLLWKEGFNIPEIVKL